MLKAYGKKNSAATAAPFSIRVSCARIKLAKHKGAIMPVAEVETRHYPPMKEIVLEQLAMVEIAVFGGDHGRPILITPPKPFTDRGNLLRNDCDNFHAHAD
jgi:hypothetical protein